MEMEIFLNYLDIFQENHIVSFWKNALEVVTCSKQIRLMSDEK